MIDPIAEAERQWTEHGWADEAASMAAVTAITRVHQLFAQRIDQLLRPDLTFARYEVLMLLAFSSRGALPMAKIGARLQVHPASITSAVDRLEAQGLVVRERTQADRRTVLARITSRGRRVAQRATNILNAEVFGDLGLSASEVRTLNDLLAKVRAHEGDPVAQ